jgi:hypothetical protein
MHAAVDLRASLGLPKDLATERTGYVGPVCTIRQRVVHSAELSPISPFFLFVNCLTVGGGCVIV